MRAPWVLPRALVAGLVGLVLAVLAHGSADGDLPSLVLLLAAWAGLTGLALAAARREWSLVPLLVALASTQTGLHMLFVRSSTGHWTHGGSVGWLCCGQGAPIAQGAGVHVAGVGLDRASIVQLLSRAIAVAICAWWLRAGETRVWTAARVLVRGVTAALRQVLVLLVGLRPVPTTFVLQRRDDPPLLRPLDLVRPVSRRGPPAVVPV